jgi:leucine dehydrogenase
VLAGRGILHVPDVVANAGGLMAAEADVRGSDAGLDEKVAGIAATATEVLETASRTGRDTVAVARDLAARRLAARRAQRPTFTAA